MAVKLDKDTLIKQRFWVLLGVAVLVALIAVAVLMVGVRKAIAGLQKKVDDQIKTSGNFKPDQVRNADSLAKLEDAEKEADKVLTNVWKEAWGQQQDLVTWPRRLERRFTTGKFAAKITVSESKEGGGSSGSEADSDSQFSGQVVRVEDNDRYLTVAGKTKKGMVEEHFYFTPHMKMVIGGQDQEAESFSKLKPGMSVDVIYSVGKYFGDELTLQEKQAYKNSYKEQYPALRDFLADARGKPLVQAKGGEVRVNERGDKIPALIRWKRSWDESTLAAPETSWLMWYNQEDYWVQRELLRTIQRANQFVAQFQPAAGNPDPRAEQKWFTFTNPYWKLYLGRKGDQLVAQLANASRAKQRLDVTFLVQVSQGKRPHKQEIAFPGETLKPGESTPELGVKIGGESPEGIYGVEQVLTLATAPVKRLDDIQMGLVGHSHRTFPKGVKAHPAAKKEAPPEENKEGESGGSNSGSGAAPNMYGKGGASEYGRGRGGKGMMPGMERMGPGGLGGGNAEADESQRYSLVTDQFRKMPVATVLLVDQDSVNYVLTAFEESKLRFQITQVTLTRYPRALQTESEDKGEEATGEEERGGTERGATERGEGRMSIASPKGFRARIPSMSYQRAMGPRPGGGGFSMPLSPAAASAGGRSTGPMPRGMPAMGPPGMGMPFGPGEAEGPADEQGPVMELVVYGYATLYGRYPPKPAAAVIAPAAGAQAAPEQPKQ